MKIRPGQDVLQRLRAVHAGLPGIATARRAHCGEDARLLDDRLPELDLLGEVGGVRLGRRLLGRDRRGAELGEARDDVLVLQRGLQRRRQLGDRVLRRAGRRVEPVPDADLEVGQAGLGGGRQVGQRRQPLRRRDRVGLHLAALDLAGGVGGLVAHEVDLAAEQIGHRRPGALVGHGGELGVDRVHEQHAAQVRGRADPGIGVGHRVRVRLHVVDELGEGRRLEVLPRDDRHRHVGDEADRREVGRAGRRRGRRRATAPSTCRCGA